MRLRHMHDRVPTAAVNSASQRADVLAQRQREVVHGGTSY